MAGVIGIDPGPRTLRELVRMAEAKTREAWNHTAAVLALFANIHRDPTKGVIFTPADFHPYENRKPKQVIPKDGIEALKIFLPH